MWAILQKQAIWDCLLSQGVQVPWVSDIALGYGEGESIAEDTANVIFFLLCLCSKDNSL